MALHLPVWARWRRLRPAPCHYTAASPDLAHLPCFCYHYAGPDEQECQAALAAATEEARQLEGAIAGQLGEAQELEAAIAAEREEAEALRAQLGDLESQNAMQVGGHGGGEGGTSCCESAVHWLGFGVGWAVTASLVASWVVVLAHMCAAFRLLQGEKVETNARFLSTAQW